MGSDDCWNQHCQYTKKHYHKQVCYKNKAGKQFCLVFFTVRNAFLVPVLRNHDLPEVRKPGRRCQEHCSGCKNMFLPGDTRRQWWPQKKLLRGTADGKQFQRLSMSPRGADWKRWPQPGGKQDQLCVEKPLLRTLHPTVLTPVPL